MLALCMGCSCELLTSSRSAKPGCYYSGCQTLSDQGESPCALLPAEDERNRLFLQKVVSIIGYMLLTASDDSPPARPFFPVKTVLAAILRVPGQTPQKNEELLWGQVRLDNPLCDRPIQQQAMSFCQLLLLYCSREYPDCLTRHATTASTDKGYLPPGACTAADNNSNTQKSDALARRRQVST